MLADQALLLHLSLYRSFAPLIPHAHMSVNLSEEFLKHGYVYVRQLGSGAQGTVHLCEVSRASCCQRRSNTFKASAVALLVSVQNIMLCWTFG